MIAPMVLLETDTDDLPLAAMPTSHRAGTQGKIEVMRKRVERGESIFHPNDNREVKPKFAIDATGPSKWGR
jgi:hypothetical protein